MPNILSLKRNNLRHNEYYNMQNIFDSLYEKSKENKIFTNLLELITMEENVKLAYRTIKNNKGSTTRGSNRETIENISSLTTSELTDMVKHKLIDYKPGKVRRVEIPKPNGKLRPLGIPNIKDRLIQQCVKQVLEPICEAKFHPHSYGFRPNRSTEHAISRMLFLNNLKGMHYVVDIDIKGFFDNVNHEKLMKQLWSLGIRDKRLLCIIGKMLKAEIVGLGKPTKGTPQGGILSPLLSNIVLNELDWWLSNQYETKQLKRDNGKPYAPRTNFEHKRKSKLKKFFLVRYADDFKIICYNYEEAKRICEATKSWLNERLKLEVSEEKTKITNLKKNYSEFLGFKFKIRNKGKKQVIKSHMSNKAKENVIRKLRGKVKEIQKDLVAREATKFNAMLLGIHTYYSIATNISVDFKEIGFSINRTLYNRLRRNFTKYGLETKAFQKFYRGYKSDMNIGEVKLFPVTGIKTKPPMCFTQEVCNYTVMGRAKIHNNLTKMTPKQVTDFMLSLDENINTELSDNAISLFVAQNGKCGITGEKLNSDYIIYHKKNIRNYNKYLNLILIKTRIQNLIRLEDVDLVRELVGIENFDNKQISKVNKLRKNIGNDEI